MHFIFGGRRMGKLDYASSLTPGAVVFHFGEGATEGAFAADILADVHLFVRDCLRGGSSPTAFFQEHLDALRGKTLIGDEIGSGIVPMEPWEREWRDETGRVYQLLARQADDVTRVWAGLPQALKRDGKPV